MLRITSDENTIDNVENVFLKKVNINAKIHLFNVNITLKKIFRNCKEAPVNTFYYFPVDQRSIIIHSFSAFIDQEEIVNKKCVKNENINTLVSTISRTQFECGEKFIQHVGVLLPLQECTVIISYSTRPELVSDSNILFTLPLTIMSKVARVSSTLEKIDVNLIQDHSLMVTYTEQDVALDQNIIIDVELEETSLDIGTHNQPITNIIPLVCNRKNSMVTNKVGQPFDFYCVLDFEAVCHQKNPGAKRLSADDIWEIIEFPICLLSSETNTIIDIFHSYVQPSIQRKLNDICISITGITQDIVDQSPTFDIVWREVLSFLAKHMLISLEENSLNCFSFTWITCGNWDLRTMLPLQLKQSGLNRPDFINNFINIKDLYMEYYPSARIRGMKDLLRKLDLPLEGRHHSGIDDTKNITKIAQWFIQNRKPLKLTFKGNP